MSYFKDIKVGDRVYELELSFGEVSDVDDKCITVWFQSVGFWRQYDFNGKICGGFNSKANQTLYKNKVKVMEV